MYMENSPTACDVKREFTDRDAHYTFQLEHNSRSGYEAFKYLLPPMPRSPKPINSGKCFFRQLDSAARGTACLGFAIRRLQHKFGFLESKASSSGRRELYPCQAKTRRDPLAIRSGEFGFSKGQRRRKGLSGETTDLGAGRSPT